MGSTKTVRFNKEDEELVNAYLKATGKTFSQLVHENIVNKIEDEIDIKAYQEFLKTDDGTKIPFEEVAKEFNVEL
ncbi:conserved domain protein [Secundilactobacillus oryzae JCM 18671]|uniref:Conserved domain protein n=2 Tax=Secundilactobacillus oryzae TaxID=1202668 RepID=A0A081BHM5_9LACO|nr:DUF6290 family protein [Secundilactobacillus oryzae]GAK47543.1 conserved domain protein [Secundilactobacillus oryzae JCM 18671]